jgi:RimJ/RimL family protein N-acetyltransferase
MLARDAWGQGYATEIAYTLLHAGFAQLDLQRVFAICDIHHLASVRVLEKAGLRRETTLYDYREAKGRSWDVYRLPTTNGCGGGGYHKLWHPYRDQMQGP